MKYLLWLFIFCTACEEAPESTPGSTVDSNTINTGDSVPAILHIDNALADSSFTVALDSMGASIKAADTGDYKK
ncbi:MAG: hypothetical protein WKF70_07090 [Chitinophagaceae bacterium]